LLHFASGSSINFAHLLLQQSSLNPPHLIPVNPEPSFSPSDEAELSGKLNQEEVAKSGNAK
jgi:hypothetical protein